MAIYFCCNLVFLMYMLCLQPFSSWGLFIQNSLIETGVLAVIVGGWVMVYGYYFVVVMVSGIYLIEVLVSCLRFGKKSWPKKKNKVFTV